MTMVTKVFWYHSHNNQGRLSSWFPMGELLMNFKQKRHQPNLGRTHLKMSVKLSFGMNEPN